MARKSTKTPEEKGIVQEVQPGQEMEGVELTPGQEADGVELETVPSQEDQTGQKQERDEFEDIPNPCVYCGPSVRGVARQYTTYQGGIPDPLKEFVKEHPAVRALIIHTGSFAAVRKRLETPGTAEAIIYKKVKAELK